MNCGAHHDIAECERCSQHYIDYEMMILCCVITVKSAGIMGLSQLDFEDLRGYAIMIKVLFICHGNICRSPMAEFVMKNWYPTQILPIIFRSLPLPPAQRRSGMASGTRSIRRRRRSLPGTGSPARGSGPGR